MDDDSSTKFIESLTKFLQSLCNGYVEFQRGVELVGHIYLNIDTGEKVDYILHEKVSKNDENSVTFVSNSFHALAKEKDGKTPANTKITDPRCSSDDDDDIVIVDQPDNSVLGSTNSGTIPGRGVKRVASGSSDQRRAGVSFHRSHSSSGSGRQIPQWRNRQESGPSATVSSQSMSQENLSIGEVKLEQLSSDELLSLASQVGDGSSSQMQGRSGGAGQSDHGSFSPNDAPGQGWIKQEPMDDSQRGLDTGWSQSDSSNSGSNLYPIMMHQNSSAFTSSPAVPGFSSPSGAASSRHGFGQCLPGTSGAANPFANPMPGTSHNMSGMDPSGGAENAGIDLSHYGQVMPNWLQELRKKDDEVRLVGDHVVERIPATVKKGRPYRKCRVCLRRGFRRETQKHCVSCPSKPALCYPACFEDFHSKPVYW